MRVPTYNVREARTVSQLILRLTAKLHDTYRNRKARWRQKHARSNTDYKLFMAKLIQVSDERLLVPKTEYNTKDEQATKGCKTRHEVLRGEVWQY